MTAVLPVFIAIALVTWVLWPIVKGRAPAARGAGEPTCPNCGPRPEGDARFCSNCGAATTR